MKEQRIRMRFRGYDHRILDRAVQDVIGVAERSGARVYGPVPLPNETKQMTVLRSPHINKTARDQFKLRQYNRMMDIVSSTIQIVEALHELNLASEVGVEIKVL